MALMITLLDCIGGGSIWRSNGTELLQLRSFQFNVSAGAIEMRSMMIEGQPSLRDTLGPSPLRMVVDKRQFDVHFESVTLFPMEFDCEKSTVLNELLILRGIRVEEKKGPTSP